MSRERERAGARSFVLASGTCGRRERHAAGLRRGVTFTLRVAELRAVARALGRGTAQRTRERGPANARGPRVPGAQSRLDKEER